MENTPACLTSTRYSVASPCLASSVIGQQHLAHLGRKFLGGGIHVELKLRLPSLIVRQARTIRRLVGTILQVDALQAHLDAADICFVAPAAVTSFIMPPELIDPTRRCDPAR